MATRGFSSLSRGMALTARSKQVSGRPFLLVPVVITHELADVFVSQEVTCAKVIFAYGLIIDDCQRSHAGEREIFGNLGTKSTQRNDQYVSRTDALLCLRSPEADLAVVQGIFIGGQASSHFRC